MILLSITIFVGIIFLIIAFIAKKGLFLKMMVSLTAISGILTVLFLIIAVATH